MRHQGILRLAWLNRVLCSTTGPCVLSQSCHIKTGEFSFSPLAICFFFVSSLTRNDLFNPLPQSASSLFFRKSNKLPVKVSFLYKWPPSFILLSYTIYW